MNSNPSEYDRSIIFLLLFRFVSHSSTLLFRWSCKWLTLTLVLLLSEQTHGKNNDVVVSKGDSVTFICNRTAETLSQIIWKTSRCFFSYLKRNNNFTTNCTSDRVNITSNSPSELNILNVQYEDTGNYQCEIVSFEGVQMAEWNLLLKHEEWPSFIYPVTTVLVVFLLSTFVAICLYRRHKSRISNQHQPSLQSGSQAAPPHTQTETDRRGNVQRRSQYFERLNSIYGHY